MVFLHKVRSFIHCTSFSGHDNFVKIQKNLINLVSLKSHGRVEHYNEKYFIKKRIKIEKKMKTKISTFYIKQL